VSQYKDPEQKGKLLLEEQFTKKPDPSWKSHLGKYPGARIESDGSALLLHTGENGTACLDHPLPAGTTTVLCRIDNTDDSGLTWGGGLALLWPGGQALRVNLRVREQRFGVDSTVGAQQLVGKLHGASSAVLRLRLTDADVLVEAWLDEKSEWQSLARFPRSKFPGDPTTVRVGKTHAVEGLDDAPQAGAPATCLVEWLRAYK
jgi:hypothetical protein